MTYEYADEDLKKLQKLELMILEEVATICDKHGIDYYIYTGTLLGAKRHKGFIPWDDDIDIAVFRKDYEKLLNILDEELDSKFYLISPNKQNECFFPFSKVCLKGTKFEDWWAKQVSFDEGIYIDIFPLDNVPENEFKRLIYYYKCHIMNHIMMNSTVHVYTGSNFRDKCHQAVYYLLNKMPISRTYWKKLYHNILTKYENSETNCITCYFTQIATPTFGKKGFFLKTEFQPPKKIKFENIEFLAPSDVDSVLTKFYGDYMKLPPEKDRINHAPEVIDFGKY